MSLLFLFRSRHGIPVVEVLPKPQGVSTPAGIVFAPKKKRRVLYRPKPTPPIPVRELQLTKAARKPEVELIREKEPQKVASVVSAKPTSILSIPLTVTDFDFQITEVKLRQFVSDTLKKGQLPDPIVITPQQLMVIEKAQRRKLEEDELLTMLIAATL